MSHKIIRLFLPILIGLTISLVFYFPYFQKHFIPAPLDIITGMYLPWLDQSRSVFPNGGPVKNPLPSDVVSLTLPLRKIAVDMVKNRQWPLWNPKILLGTPLLANFQTAIGNPLNILYLSSISFIDVWSIQIILQSFLAFIFFYLFISQYQKNIYSRLIGSLIWAFNGFFVLWFQYNTVVYAALYLPLALFTVTKISQNYLWGFLLAISLALSVYSGNPPVTLIVFGAVLLNILVIYWPKPKNIFISILFILLSIAFSAPQLFIGLSSSQNSIRQFDTVAATANIKYLQPDKLLTLFVPDFFGNPTTRNTWENYPLYDNSTIYNGLLPLILFLLSFKLIFKNKQKQILIYSYLIAIISFVAMIPSPISQFIGSLNFLGLSSMVFTRFSFLWSFALAIITSLTIKKVFKNKIKYQQIFYSFFIVSIFIFVPLLLTFVLNQYFLKIPLIDYIWLNQTKTAYRNCLYPAIIIALNFILITAIYYLKSKTIKKILLIFLFLLTTFDLYKFFTKYNSFSSTANFYPQSELTDYLNSNSFRFARESSQLIPSNMWLMYPQLQTPSGYDTTYSQNYGQFISLINGSKLTSNNSNRYLEIDKFDSPLFNLLSVDNIIVTKTDRFGLADHGTINNSLTNKKFKLIKDYGRYVVLKNSTSLPFIRPVKQIFISQNTDQTEQYLSQKNVNDIAVVNSNFTVPSKLNYDVKINNLVINSQKISLNTNSTDNQFPSFLVISQNYDTGWKLKINGTSSQIYQTNHTFTGIYLPPGNHQIVLEYKPDIFFLSLKIFIVSIIASLLSIIIVIWRKNQN